MQDKTPPQGKVNVVLYWHMHQPEYRDLRNGQYQLPWTYLHTIKDYVDMVAHLEAYPKARAVVNFAPILLEQILDYKEQLNGFLDQGRALRDPLLAALADPVISNNPEKRLSLVKDCLRANEQHLVKRYPQYHRLAELARASLDDNDILQYFSDQFYIDLLVWYHLAWLGETVRMSDERVQALQNKGEIFSLHDRRLLLELIRDLVQGVLPRYQKLAEQKRIELSFTPYAHPIMPLLLDIESAREAVPDIALPEAKVYPGGEQRSRWHIDKGLQVFEQCFGMQPAGCWPSEGGISEATLELLAEKGIAWTASGETVLRNSLHASGMDTLHCIHQPFKLHGVHTTCFFRDDGLSDHIGFKYADWRSGDAVANMVHHIENIASACGKDESTIISIILDGENAWEYYPNNGYYFLSHLYEVLSSHKQIKLTTYSEYLQQQYEPIPLKHIVAGSWVYGSFTTWIGDTDKNRAWDMLVDAKQVYDSVIASGKLSAEQSQQAEQQLAICEGSDWFWWFGDYNPADSVESFDEQYRIHLCNLYHLLGESPPEYLSQGFSHGNGAPAMGGVMLPGKQH